VETLRQNRFVVMLTTAEEQAIQDFRFTNRIGTKADAARELIARGLRASDEEVKGPAEAPTSPSHDQNPNPAKDGGI